MATGERDEKSMVSLFCSFFLPPLFFLLSLSPARDFYPPSTPHRSPRKRSSKPTSYLLTRSRWIGGGRNRPRSAMVRTKHSKEEAKRERVGEKLAQHCDEKQTWERVSFSLTFLY